jgi:hypothetical protein
MLNWHLVFGPAAVGAQQKPATKAAEKYGHRQEAEGGPHSSGA